jgi:excisionase family DNA binding protein
MEPIVVPIDKPWLAVADIAGYLGVSSHVVTALLRAREIPAVKMGREWRVARQDLEDWLNRRREEALA